MADFEVRVLRTDDYLRVLQDEGLLTFAVVIGDYECHNQLSIAEYDTREKVEQRMAEVGAQVAAEVARNRITTVIPADIQALVDAS